MAALGLTTGDLKHQSDWHESFRDTAKNMYRTSYQDMSHGREVAVKSDFPSGYGGHVPSVRHDMLFRNTALDRQIALRRNDPSRDAFPSFSDHIAGIPTITRFPQGAKRAPIFGVVPHNGTTTMLKPPWGIMTTNKEPLSHRTTPPTMTPRGRASMTARSVLGSKPPGSAPPATGMSGVSAVVKQANTDAQKEKMPTEAEVLVLASNDPMSQTA